LDTLILVAKSTINIKQPLSSSDQSVRSEWDSEKLLCLSHFLIACSSCWDFVEDTGFETGQQEVIGKLSQIRQLNPLSLSTTCGGHDQYSRKVLAVATFSVQPSMVKFLLQEAFKEPSKS